MQLDLADWSQRWEERAARWCPRHRLCDTRTLDAHPLDDDTTAEAFVAAHHYSGSYPAARVRIGLYERGELAGVAVYGEPAGPTVLSARLGLDTRSAAELSRFVLLDRVGYNAESWFLGRCHALLRALRPEWRALIAYSDPVPRRTDAGALVLPGHWGQIYQAVNACYLGRATPRTLYLDAEGRVVSERAISKIRKGARGEVYARALIAESGAPPQEDGESVGDWLARCRLHWRRVRHPGNHTYAFRLTRRAPRYVDAGPRPRCIDLIREAA